MKQVITAWNNFIALLYPNLCAACETPLVQGERVICTACRYNIPKTNYWKDDENPLAKSLWGRVRIEKACAYFYFHKGSAYRKLLHQLKYKGQKRIGVTMGQLFATELLSCGWIRDIDCVVPVPLHPKKQRQRGYNQSDCIAQGICSAAGLPLVTNNLLKTVYTESQTQRNRTERLENVIKSFAVCSPADFEGKHILLIDDVFTTGATLEACAQTLLSACNCKVSIATLAFANQ